MGQVVVRGVTDSYVGRDSKGVPFEVAAVTSRRCC
jgi:hypothetical protein